MPSCIYCRRENPEFDREHVIPQAFGSFEPHSFILYDAVCKECNNFFGRTLDLALSRDSMEAVLRFRHGTKPASEAGDLPYRKLELKVGQPGPWFGATVVLEPDATGQAVEPIPVSQAAFRWKGSQDWTFLVERELTADALAKYVKPVPGTLEIQVMGPDHGERVLEILKSAGINFRQESKLISPITDDGKVLVEVAAAVDQTIFRAITKIAFNYAAHQHGSSFVLRSEFDDVRSYVRYGTAPSWMAQMPVVLPFHQPILYDDGPLYRQTNGHLITFDWNNGRTGFLSQVSLFNSVTYNIAICPGFKGLWRDDYYRGHHFNTEDRTIVPLTRVSKPLLLALR